jgi:hypothetical protein
MAERKRKPSFVQILIIMAILWIMISILGGGRQKQKAQRTAPRAPASSQIERPSEGSGFFMPRR